MLKARWKKVVLAILLFFFLMFNYIQAMKVKNDNFPFTKVDTSSWNPLFQKSFEGSTEVDLLRNLLTFQGSDGDFSGTIRQYHEGYDNDRVLVILVRNNYSGDDAMGPFENKYVAKYQNNKYKVIEFSSRHSCSRDLSFLSFFIDPIWTNHACP
jgi:hypothetical protein